MRKFIRVKVLLAGACIVTGLTAQGQRAQSAERQTSGSLGVGGVYHPLLATGVSGSRFWMQGGSVQGHGQFWHGLSVVGDVSGLHTASTGGSSGVGWGLGTGTFGPRD